VSPRPLRESLCAISVVVAVALFNLAQAGCGGDSDAAEGGSRAYVELLSGLKRAALSDGSYNAVHRAKALDSPEKAVIDSFCKFAWQTVVNHEIEQLDQHTFVVGRIRYTAEVDVNGWEAAHAGIDAGPIRARLGELRSVIHLASLNFGLVRHYARACHR